MTISRWMFYQAFVTMASTLYIFWKSAPYGLALPFTWTFEEYLTRFRVTIIILATCGYFIMVLQDYFKRRAMRLIRAEKDWFTASSGMLAIADLSRNLGGQLETPVTKLGADVHALCAEEDWFSPRVQLQFGEITATVERLIVLSRSFQSYHPK